MADKIILQPASHAGTWVFQYIPAGQPITIYGENVPTHLKKDHDVLQGQVVTQNNKVGPQFMPDTAVTLFLKQTRGLTAEGAKQYFGVSRDWITLEELSVLRAWVRKTQQAHQAKP